MLLSLDQLDAHLSKPLVPLYVIYGDGTDEPLLALEAADKMRAAARAQGFTERNVMMTERGFDWSTLREASASLSLFGGKTFIDLRIPNGKPGIEGGAALVKFSEDLARDKAAKDVLALITLPQMDWKSQQTSWFMKLQGNAAMAPVKAIDRQELPRWIAVRLSRQNQRAEQEALQFIADRVEGNLLAAHQEIQKLGLLYPEGELSVVQVTDAVLNVARYDVFKLNQAMLSGDAARLARMLGGLKAEGEAPPLVLWTMADEIRLLARVLVASGGRDVAGVLRDLRVPRARQGSIEAAARNVTLAAAKGALRHAARIDRMIKGLARGDIWDELLQLGLRFSK